jgi:hypothetical protein
MRLTETSIDGVSVGRNSFWLQLLPFGRNCLRIANSRPLIWLAELRRFEASLFACSLLAAKMRRDLGRYSFLPSKSAGWVKEGQLSPPEKHPTDSLVEKEK